MPPTLHFFRTISNELSDRPPLANSLQSFESSLISLRHQRFPEALIQCITAWESGLKAFFKIQSGDNISLWKLEERVLAISGMSELNAETTRACRELRNRIIHFGYTPEDDRTSAEMLLKIGYPFLRQMYEVCFDIDLKDSLILELGNMFEIAHEMYEQSPEPTDPGERALMAFQPLISLIKVRFDSPVSDADELLLTDDNMTWEYRYEAVSQWTRKNGYETKRYFCPVCTELWFEAIWDGETENDNIYSGGICFACNFVIREDLKWLTKRLFSDENL